MEIAHYSAIISCVFSFFLLSIVGFNNAYKVRGNIFILFAVIILSFLLVIDYIEKQYNPFQSPISLHIMDSIRWIFLFPILIYLFLQKKSIKCLTLPTYWKFFLPFFIFSIFRIVFYKEWHTQFTLQLIEEISLLVFSLCLFYISQKKLKEGTDETHKKWNKEVLNLSMGILFFYIGYKLNKLLIGSSLTGFANLLKFCAVVYSFRITYKGINELKNHIQYPAPSLSLQLASENISLTDKQSHKNTDYSSYLEKIDHFIGEEKLYKDPMLSRNVLAEKLGISPGYLSEIINTSYNCNFNQLINQYRVQESIKLLTDPQYSKYNIESIGYDVGFNSKTSFYQAFKKETGTTPSKYLSK